MIKINKNIVMVSAASICLGFFSCAILVNAYKDMNSKYVSSINELTELLNTQQTENEKLNRELNDKNSKIVEYENAVSKAEIP